MLTTSLLGLSVSAVLACGGTQADEAAPDLSTDEAEGSGEIINSGMYGLAPLPEIEGPEIVIEPVDPDDGSETEELEPHPHPVPVYGIPPEPEDLPPSDE